jgi:hypothetical protein
MNTVARVGPAVADLKRRIPILNRLIIDCDRLAADLDQEVRNEEDRVKIHDPAHSAYSTYARATALRRDNLMRSADELRVHLAKAEKALVDLGAAALDAWASKSLPLCRQQCGQGAGGVRRGDHHRPRIRLTIRQRTQA